MDVGSPEVSSSSHHQLRHNLHVGGIHSSVISSNLTHNSSSMGRESEVGESVDLDLWDLDLNNVYTNGGSGSCESSVSHPVYVNGAGVPHGNGIVAKRTVARTSSLAVSSFSDSSSGREDDMSPSGFGADSCEGKKKKGPVPRQQEELCLVCGDRASGYHYNALTCEGCKGFFRRSITKNAVYQCKYGNNCEIDMYMRRKCQECRLKKCLTVGMRPECVVPEYQCLVKREAKKAQKDKDKPNSTTQSPTSKEQTDIKSSLRITFGLDDRLSINGKSSSRSPSRTLSVEQEELINRLVYFQDEFEQPNEEDLKRVTVNNAIPGEGEDASESRFRHITEMTILTVQLIVEFSKRLPGFDKLEREDQITLLKACSSEVMMLRTARRYDFQSDTIVFANNLPYTRDNYSMAGVGDSADPLFNFCRNMCTMKVDNAEYALLTAIVIFSERPSLQEPRKVEKIQEIYLEALRAYVEYLHPVRPGINFAKLLGVLTELRTLGNINSEMCFSLKLKNKKLPPFLEEIWDVKM